MSSKTEISKGDLLKVFKETGDQTMYHVKNIDGFEIMASRIDDSKDKLFIQVWKDATRPKDVSPNDIYNQAIDDAIALAEKDKNGYEIVEKIISKLQPTMASLGRPFQT
jgi:hypothetical protein